jgi:hypothetical protein
VCEMKVLWALLLMENLSFPRFALSELK